MFYYLDVFHSIHCGFVSGFCFVFPSLTCDSEGQHLLQGWKSDRTCSIVGSNLRELLFSKGSRTLGKQDSRLYLCPDTWHEFTPFPEITFWLLKWTLLRSGLHHRTVNDKFTCEPWPLPGICLELQTCAVHEWHVFNAHSCKLVLFSLFGMGGMCMMQDAIGRGHVLSLI